jgi:hypothetical protein
MALDPSIWLISPVSSKTYIFWVHPKSEEKSLDLGTTSFRTCSLCLGDPCVQVSLNLVPHSSRIKDEKKFLGGPDISSNFTRYIWCNRTYPVQGRTCLLDSFQPDVRPLFWSYFANRVFVWSHSSSASFITLWGSFVSGCLVFFITFPPGFLLGVLNVRHRPVSCEGNFIRLQVTPLQSPLLALIKCWFHAPTYWVNL